MKNNNLHNIQKSGYKVPTDYFENFETSIIHHANLKEKASDSGFTLPKDYFENIENEILAKATAKKTVNVIPIFSRKSLVYAASIAATILLFFNLSNINTKVTYDSLSEETIENYVFNQDYYTNDLAFLFDDVEILEEDFNSILFSDENIQNYLNNNIELNDLYTE